VKLSLLIDTYNEGQKRIVQENNLQSLDYEERYAEVVEQFKDVIKYAERSEQKNQRLKMENNDLKV
jgi:hypothetical protein